MPHLRLVSSLRLSSGHCRITASQHAVLHRSHLSTHHIVASSQPNASPRRLVSAWCLTAMPYLSSPHRFIASTQRIASLPHIIISSQPSASPRHLVLARCVDTLPHLSSPCRVVTSTQCTAFCLVSSLHLSLAHSRNTASQLAVTQLTASRPLVSPRCIASPCLSLACRSSCSVHRRLHIWLILSLAAVSLSNCLLILSLAAFNSACLAHRCSPR